MDCGSLKEIAQDDVYEHLYELYTEHRPRENQHLGYVDKSNDSLEIFLPLSGVDLKVRQSLASLSSGTQSSSTGFICWQVASLFADWATASPQSPFNDINDKVILELGAGVSSVLVSVLGPRSRHYVASDQRHVLRLLKENFRNNVVSQKFISSTCEKTEGAGPRQLMSSWSKIDFIELDWEHPNPGVFEFRDLTGTDCPDYVFACDTIYNSYLIPHFLACLKAVMASHTVAIIAMQLRDEAVTEEFLEAALEAELRVFCVKHEILTKELSEGFVVYCLRI